MSWYLLFLNKGRSFHLTNIDRHTLGSQDVLNPIDATIVATDIDSDNHTLTSYAGFFLSDTFRTAAVFFFLIIHKHINSNTQLKQTSRPGMLI